MKVKELRPESKVDVIELTIRQKGDARDFSSRSGSTGKVADAKAVDDEGTEVARLLGSGRAMLLYGHGAVTAGASMEASVTDMIQLEHQAEMNYYAYSMGGPDHPYVSREKVLEFSARKA